MLQLSDRDWAEFRVQDIFRITQGRKWITKSDIENNPGKTPLISCSGTNNGIMGSVNPSGINKCTVVNNVLTVAVSGSAGATFYQGIEAVINSGVLILDGIEFSDKETYLFICALVREVNSKFNYGLKASADRVGNQIINLPITSDGLPDYQFMHDYIAEREPDYSWATQCIEPNAELSLTDREWAEFRVGDLFNIKTGKAYNKNKIEVAESGLRHISRATSNHGIDCYVNLDSINGIVTYEGNCVTVSSIPYTDGTCAFYQDKRFCCGVGVNIVTHELMTPELGQFICTCINHAVVGKYGMARSLSIRMLSEEVINLPITSEGLPDYDFMERYIKSLPFSKVLEA